MRELAYSLESYFCRAGYEIMPLHSHALVDFDIQVVDSESSIIGTASGLWKVSSSLNFTTLSMARFKTSWTN